MIWGVCRAFELEPMFNAKQLTMCYVTKVRAKSEASTQKARKTPAPCSRVPLFTLLIIADSVVFIYSLPYIDFCTRFDRVTTCKPAAADRDGTQVAAHGGPRHLWRPASALEA